MTIDSNGSMSSMRKITSYLSSSVSSNGKELVTKILLFFTVLAILIPLDISFLIKNENNIIPFKIILFLSLFWAFTPLGRNWVKFIFTFSIGFIFTGILAWFASLKTGGGVIDFNQSLIQILREEFNSINPKWFLLAKFGWFGGLIYSILADGRLELPSIDIKNKNVDPGFIGDVLVGVAGAFIAYTLVISSTNSDASVEQLNPSTLVVLGIVGGYGGKAILKSSLKKFVGTADSDSTVEDDNQFEGVEASGQALDEETPNNFDLNPDRPNNSVLSTGENNSLEEAK